MRIHAMSDWEEVKRGTPAEEIDLVPDSAIVWSCWVKRDGNAAVTIYRDEARDFRYYVTYSRGPEMDLAGVTGLVDVAKELADEKRDRL